MKFHYTIKEIDKKTVLEMVKKYHYSDTLPHLNKYYLGFYLNNELVGVVTLGWGTRPKHTIKKIFPSLDTLDYFEIGRMCMTEDMPRNSESQMLRALIKWIKLNKPNVKILFTWADGMLGKVGYVYQASNFYFCGNSVGEFYMQNGIKIHIRNKSMFGITGDKRKTVRPTMEQMKEHNIQHYKGKQFRYIYFLTTRAMTKRLMSESLIDINRDYPKDHSLEWRIRLNNRNWVKCGKPEYKTDKLK